MPKIPHPTAQKLNGNIANFRLVCRGRIYASRAVCPLGRIARIAATGGIYAAPTEHPLCCCCCEAARRGQDPSLHYYPKRAFAGKFTYKKCGAIGTAPYLNSKHQAFTPAASSLWSCLATRGLRPPARKANAAPLINSWSLGICTPYCLANSSRIWS